MALLSLLAGGLVTAIGYYTPLMYVATIMMPIGSALLSLLKPDTPSRTWIGYQMVLGIGIGCGFQQPLIAAQAALPSEDVPIGTAIMMFTQLLGGVVIASIGSNVFNNQLAKNLLAQVPDFNTTPLLHIGATQVQSVVPPQFLPEVLSAYNKAIDQTFYVAVVMSCLALIPLLFVEWKSVKGKNLGSGPA
jgi:MFS family permease